jgi:tetratricopeptide (TPR) repeat protein
MKILDSGKTAELRNTVAEGYLKEGISKFDDRDFSGCIEECTKAEELNPDEDDIFLYRGRAFFQLGKYIEAYRDFEIFHLRFWWLEDAQLYHGLVCVKLGFFKTALRDLDAYLNQIDYYNIAHYYHGLANMGLEEYALAIQDFNNAIETSYSDFAEAFFQRSLAFAKLGNSKSAKADFTMAIELNPLLKVEAYDYYG